MQDRPSTLLELAGTLVRRKEKARHIMINCEYFYNYFIMHDRANRRITGYSVFASRVSEFVETYIDIQNIEEREAFKNAIVMLLTSKDDYLVDLGIIISTGFLVTSEIDYST